MNLICSIKKIILENIKKEFGLADDSLSAVQINLNVDASHGGFGDLSCNAAMVLSKALKKNPRDIAEQIKKIIETGLAKHVESVEIAGPGFINIGLKSTTWDTIAKELFDKKGEYFKLDPSIPRKKYLLEYVSANPTGPLHLGHGRGGIIGDVLANVLEFVGHQADREYYINDAGSQMAKLGRSFKARCQQELGKPVEFPEDGYAGQYLVDLAKTCVEHYGNKVLQEEDEFFENYAKEQMLEHIKNTLDSYGISLDTWFSEIRLHKNGSIDAALELLLKKKLAYEKDEAIWFKSTEFGDDKDRVVKKSDETFTYIGADIAYHKDKFERGYNVLINVWGQDHHGYVKRLQGTMKALGYDSEEQVLDVILYQLVSIKHDGEQVKMSKRAGTFEKLSDVIEAVGKDVARFFYLNRKAEAHLEFDMATALKKTDENPVYYIQYAYVRTNSLLEKAQEHEGLACRTPDGGIPRYNFATQNHSGRAAQNSGEIGVIKKICSLDNILKTIATSYQTHLLAYYTLELAKQFHTFYAKHKIIDPQDIKTSQNRLFVTKLVQQTLGLCLDLLGISKPKRM